MSSTKAASRITKDYVFLSTWGPPAKLDVVPSLLELFSSHQMIRWFWCWFSVHDIHMELHNMELLSYLYVGFGGWILLGESLVLKLQVFFCCFSPGLCHPPICQTRVTRTLDTGCNVADRFRLWPIVDMAKKCKIRYVSVLLQWFLLWKIFAWCDRWIIYSLSSQPNYISNQYTDNYIWYKHMTEYACLHLNSMVW